MTHYHLSNMSNILSRWDKACFILFSKKKNLKCSTDPLRRVQHKCVRKLFFISCPNNATWRNRHGSPIRRYDAHYKGYTHSLKSGAWWIDIVAFQYIVFIKTATPWSSFAQYINKIRIRRCRLQWISSDGIKKSWDWW